MSKRDLRLTQTIADLAYSVSSQNGMSLEDSLSFVYNSDTLNQVLDTNDDISYGAVESSLIRELKFGSV